MAYVPEDVNPTSNVQSNKSDAYELQNPAVRSAVAEATAEKASSTQASDNSTKPEESDTDKGSADTGSRQGSSSSRTDDGGSDRKDSSLASDVSKAAVIRAAKDAESTAVKAAAVKADDSSTDREIKAAQSAADDAKDRLVSSRRNDDNDERPAAGSLSSDVSKAEVLRAKSEAETKTVNVVKVKADDKATIGDIAAAQKDAAEAKADLESLVEHNDDDDSSVGGDDQSLEEIIAELEGNYGLDWQNGKYLGSPPGSLPGAGQIMSNIIYGRSQRPDPQLADKTPEETRELEDSQQLLASGISSGIVYMAAPGIDNLAAQYAPGYFKLPVALATKVAVGRVVNPIAQEGADLYSDYMGQPNVVPGPGIVSMENVGDIAPATASIVAGGLAQNGTKAALLGGAALAGISIPEPITTAAGLASAVYVGGKVFVVADNLLPDILPKETYTDKPADPPTIEEYETMLAVHSSVVKDETASVTMADEEPETVTEAEIEAVMPSTEQLEAIWGPQSSSGSNNSEVLETGPKWPSATGSEETLEPGPKYPPVVLEEPADRPVAQPAGESVPEETLERSVVKTERVSNGDRSPEALSVKPVDTDEFPVRSIAELPETWKTFVDRVKGGFDQVRDLASELPERFFASEDTGPRLIIDTRPLPPHLVEDGQDDEPVFTLGDFPRFRENDDDHRGEEIGGLPSSCDIKLWMAPYIARLLKLGVEDLCQFEGWSKDQLESQINELEVAQQSSPGDIEKFMVACTFGVEEDDGFQFLTEQADTDYGLAHDQFFM